MGFRPDVWRLRTRRLSNEDHTLLMGVVNVTPDSFSDGGEHFSVEAAVARGRQVLAAGADIVDVGGESTRPGADLTDAAQGYGRWKKVSHETHVPTAS